MYDALFEDEDDIFSGTPQSKFMDIIYNASKDLAKQELTRLMERQAALEMMLEERVEDLEGELRRFAFENQDAVDTKTKSLFIESVGNILTQNE